MTQEPTWHKIDGHGNLTYDHTWLTLYADQWHVTSDTGTGKVTLHYLASKAMPQTEHVASPKQEQIEHIHTLLAEVRTALEALRRESGGRLLDSSNESDHYDLFVHYALRDIESVENCVRGAQRALGKQQSALDILITEARREIEDGEVEDGGFGGGEH